MQPRLIRDWPLVMAVISRPSLAPRRLETKCMSHHITACQRGGAFSAVRNLGSALSAVCPSQNGGLGCPLQRLSLLEVQEGHPSMQSVCRSRTMQWGGLCL